MSASQLRFAWSRQRLRRRAWVAGLCAVAAGCQGASQVEAPPAEPVTLASPKVAPRSAKPVAAAAPAERLARDELAAMFVSKELDAMPLDHVDAFFERFGPLERATFPDEVMLEGRSTDEKLTIKYRLQPDGSWRFAGAQLELRSEERSDSDATYGEVEKEVRRQLGKPKESVRENDTLPGVMWKRKRQELWMSQAAPRVEGGSWAVVLERGKDGSGR